MNLRLTKHVNALPASEHFPGSPAFHLQRMCWEASSHDFGRRAEKMPGIMNAGKVRSAVCDLTPGEETGAIHSAYASEKMPGIMNAGKVRSAVCDLTPGEETGAIHSAYASEKMPGIMNAGKVRSAVCDLTPGEETGAIHSAYASVNDEPLPQSAVTVTVSKQDTPAGQDRPYPYEGTFSHTLTGVKVTEGKNTLGLIVSDPLYHLSGTAEVGFEIDATPPGGAGGAFASETAVTLELPVAGSTLAADEARLSVETQEATLANGVILKRQTGNALLYRSTDGQAVFQFTQAPTLTTTTAEAVHGFITLPQAGWAGAAFSPMTETDVNSGAFVWSAQEEFAGYWGWSVSAGPVDAAVESGVGEFHAYTVRLVGPQTLLEQVGRVHLAGVSLPVLVQNGIARLADALHPGQPATIATLPMESRQAAYLPEEEENEVSPGLAELGIGENWEEQDLPEAFYVGEGHWGAKGRMASTQGPENGMSLTQRLQRQAGIWWEDHTSTGYYKGFVTGFFDNPYTTGKDAVASVVGISEKAANVLWLTSPLRTVWEFTYGDAYQGEIQTAIRAGQRAKEIGGQTYQVLKEWGPEVLRFLFQLQFDALTLPAKQAMIAAGIPGIEMMGPESRLALNLVIQLIFWADDAWADLEPYQRGYWQGYIMFEIIAVVVLTVVTAEAGGAGGAAALARHAPKLTRLYTFLEKLLDRLEDVPALGRLVTRIREFMLGLRGSCFVAGTLVLTLRGLIPIEQVKEDDWVWSRAEDDSGVWRWRRVLKTKVSQTTTLYHIHVQAMPHQMKQSLLNALQDWRAWASGGALAVLCSLGTPARESIGCTAEHPFWVDAREAQPVRAFLPASGLRSGDALRRADGGIALITGITMVHAKPGETFTTYNFEVADDHTYCVGGSGIWVHNWCTARKERFMADALTLAKQKGWPTGGIGDWLGPKGQRLEHIADVVHSQELINVRDKLGNVTLGQLVHEAVVAELKDYNGPNDLGNIWSYTKQREMIFKDKIPSRDKKGMPSFGGGWEVHHLLEKALARKLGLVDGKTVNRFGEVFDENATPSIPLRGYADADYTAAFKKQFGPNAEVPYHQESGVGIKHLIGKLNGTPDKIMAGLRDIYTKPPFEEMKLWPATRDYLQRWLDNVPD